MADIYDRNGEFITQGLECTLDSIQAEQAAKRIAADIGQEVYLEDDVTDERWTVYPDGRIESGWDWQ